MTIANFAIEYYQYLKPDGTLCQPLPKGLDNNALLELYRLMHLLRMFDGRAINLQRVGKLGTYASTLGQEAIGVAMGHAMYADDVLVPYYRDYGAQYQRGVAFHKILQYWGGDERGSDFDNAEDFPICVPIASQSVIATGVATAIKYRQQKRAVVTTIGEGGTSEGDFYEALNVAGAWNLPVVFVVNNNQWAISVSREQQTHCQTIAQKAIAAGFSGEQVDGNDAIAVHERMRLALEKARSGGGPTLIEAITYRLCDHTTADDANRYRPKEELDMAWQVEPLVRLRAYLTAQKVWDDSKEEALLLECRKDIDKDVDIYLSIKPAPVTDMIDYMYAEWPEALKEQRATLLQFGGSPHD
ncbi:MAG: pdhA [Gammaproteobacteria bacterium]|jgi:pyruvate dehydrogenase E1 component alpha subunit|nr:pdhA [Gammaproteobacteria bacterium]